MALCSRYLFLGVGNEWRCVAGTCFWVLVVNGVVQRVASVASLVDVGAGLDEHVTDARVAGVGGAQKRRQSIQRPRVDVNGVLWRGNRREEER